MDRLTKVPEWRAGREAGTHRLDLADGRVLEIERRQWLRQALALGGLATASFFAAGCAPARPTDAQIKLLIETELERLALNGVFGVQSVQRLDGRAEGDVYVAEVQYVLVFKEGFKELTAELKGQLGPTADPVSALRGGSKMMVLGLAHGDFKKGDTREFRRRLRLLRSERGWLLEAGVDLITPP